jgi:hypothetical protein
MFDSTGGSAGRGRMVRGVVAALAAALVLAAAGCISVEEEVDLRPDGTVKYAADFTLPEMFIAGLSDMAETSGGKSLADEWVKGDSTKGDSTRHREFAEGRDHHFVSERDFASLEHLAVLSARAAATPDSARKEDMSPEMPLGGIEVTRLDARRVRLRRVLESPSAKAGPGGEDDSTNAGAKRMFAGHFYVFRLRAPAIESANGVIAADRKSVEWRVPMNDLMGDSAAVPEAVLVHEPRSKR